MKVKDIMTKDVVRAHPAMSVGEVTDLLAKHRITGVPVVDDDGAVVGLVSEYDLLSRKGKTAGEVMTAGVISVNEETDVEDVRFLLVERRIRRVPVLAGRELVGIVSRSDIVRLMALQWVCQVCGESIRGDRAPERCPKCAAPQDRFFQEAQHPGM
jgi:CBS domain-containing protein